MTRLTFAIDGTSCAACAIRIDDAIEALPGVTRSQTSVRRRRATVDLDDDSACDARQITAAVAAAGYTATLEPDS